LFDTGVYHESLGLVFTHVPQAFVPQAFVPQAFVPHGTCVNTKPRDSWYSCKYCWSDEWYSPIFNK